MLNTAKKRVGHGSGSGLGKTSGRGQKDKKHVVVEASIQYLKVDNYLYIVVYLKEDLVTILSKKEYAVINLSDLNVFEDGTVVTPALLKEKGIVKKQLSGIKVLGEGQLEKKLTVQAHKFSKSAIDKINESGSKAEVI